MSDEGGVKDLRQVVFEALGAASVCWTDMRGTGVFKSDQAKRIGDDLVAYIENEYRDQVLRERSGGNE